MGRLGSRIHALPESLALRVFVDAGGRAAENRVWGGLAIVDDFEAAWLDRTMHGLKARHADLCLPSGELKGAELTDDEVRNLGRRIKDEDHRVLFWANWFRAATDPRMATLGKKAVDFLREVRADHYRLDAMEINNRYDRMAIFLENLKGINRHKVVSTLAHLGWLMEELKLRSLGPQLRSVSVVLDREDIPLTRDCAEFLRLFLVPSLQAVGMSARITWRSLREAPGTGAIMVEPDADSRTYSGLQFVDILLQGVQRGLPGYSRRRKGGHTNTKKERPCQITPPES